MSTVARSTTIRLRQEGQYLDIIQEDAGLGTAGAAMRAVVRIVFQLQRRQELVGPLGDKCVLAVDQLGTPVRDVRPVRVPVVKRHISLYFDKETAGMVERMALRSGQEPAFVVRQCLMIVGPHFEQMRAIRRAGGQPILCVDQTAPNGTVSRRTEIWVL